MKIDIRFGDSKKYRCRGNNNGGKCSIKLESTQEAGAGRAKKLARSSLGAVTNITQPGGTVGFIQIHDGDTQILSSILQAGKVINNFTVARPGSTLNLANGLLLQYGDDAFQSIVSRTVNGPNENCLVSIPSGQEIGQVDHIIPAYQKGVSLSASPRSYLEVRIDPNCQADSLTFNVEILAQRKSDGRWFSFNDTQTIPVSSRVGITSWQVTDPLYIAGATQRFVLNLDGPLGSDLVEITIFEDGASTPLHTFNQSQLVPIAGLINTYKLDQVFQLPPGNYKAHVVVGQTTSPATAETAFKVVY